jgi:hypothetical protein
MQGDPDLTRTVRSWLRQDDHEVADRVLDNVVALLDATPQRRALWPARRLPYVNTPLRLAVAGAAVVVLALIGVNLIATGGSFGGIGGPPSPPPLATIAPSAAPTLPPTGEIAPGRYRSDSVTFTLPAGWSSSGSWDITKGGGRPPAGMVFTTWTDIATVYRDPCRSLTSGAFVGPTVDALVAALVAQTSVTTSAPVDVTIDGFRGKEIRQSVPKDIKIIACDGSKMLFWDNSGTDQSSACVGECSSDVIDILDVNGRRLVFDRSTYPATSAKDQAELQAIIDSIKITP